jgi:hypothetical protein
MNIKTEKKKYMPPRMEILNFTREAALLNASDRVEYQCDDCVDVEEVGGTGFNGSFN